VSNITESGAYRVELDPDERIALAKKRRSYINGIRKWDFYSLRNAPEEALAYYLSVQEKLPDDQVVRKKIAHVYFIMKDWWRSYREYIGVPILELSESERNEMLASLFFDDSTFDRLGELDKLQLLSGTLDYYRTVDTCYTTMDDCRKEIESYTGSEYRINELKSQIQAAGKLTPDIQYRNLLIAGTFYKQGMFRASEKILADILAERPDYTEVKKMLGFSLFELGNYEWAKKYLLEYLERNPNDIESIIRMGEVSAKIGDYVASNLYLNNAITAGYTPKTNLERRLAYNYSLLWDTVGMLKVMNYLLQESDATEDDFAVGVSLAIQDGQYARAVSWARAGLDRFVDSTLITPLYVQSLRLNGELDNASAIIQNMTEEDMVRNPNFLLEKAIILSDYGDYTQAKDLFRELISLEDWPDIVTESELYLDRIAVLEGQ
jgi:tetratricopeptide (TPR) repeat protein